ncbi:MAG: zinc finger-like domain-containing protein [Clostridia bacterium]|nr:zinc finger-like domain-containing protein [Clostridia bacterium]
MNGRFTKLISVFLVACLLFTVFAYAGGLPAYEIGDVDNDGAISAADARLALRASVGLEKMEKDTQRFLSADADIDGKITSADARLILRVSVKLDTFYKIENVEGYPKTDDDKVLHAFFVNGKRMSFDVYTYGDSPDVYAPPCLICWLALDIDAVSVSRSVGGKNVDGAFGARINGKVVTNHTGSDKTLVGGGTYPDLVPEYYNNDYHCSLLLFQKALNATVEFSPDSSAVYLTHEKAYPEGSKCDDFDLEPDGTLAYDGPSDNGFVPGKSDPIEEPSTIPSEEPTSNPSEEPSTNHSTGPKTITCPVCAGTGHTTCTVCGGSGRTWGTQTTYRIDPITGMMMPTTVPAQVTCMACGGVPFKICSGCGGSGHIIV